MIRVSVGQEKNTRIVMVKTSKRSVEMLTHFNCVYCKKWWSIGDAAQDKHEWFCPWCGKKNTYKKV